jgi:LPXTG-site transpeptidase (sortase) family protein
MGVITRLPLQPEDKAYDATDLVLEIPSLGQKMTIVGVPQGEDGWDVSWLGGSAGWLHGSAYPTWVGNTVLTGHVWDAYNRPGPLAKLRKLKYGDRFYIYANGLTYTYAVRENQQVTLGDVAVVLRHEEMDWVSLVTCEAYDAEDGVYAYRRLVRAVLVEVK